jgi:ATP-dependent DNA ligase
MSGADWSKRYPLIVESAARINGTAILDAEVVWIGSDGDLLALDGDDLRKQPLSERKAAAGGTRP